MWFWAVGWKFEDFVLLELVISIFHFYLAFFKQNDYLKMEKPNIGFLQFGRLPMPITMYSMPHLTRDHMKIPSDNYPEQKKCDPLHCSTHSLDKIRHLHSLRCVQIIVILLARHKPCITNQDNNQQMYR